MKLAFLLILINTQQVARYMELIFLKSRVKCNCVQLHGYRTNRAGHSCSD